MSHKTLKLMYVTPTFMTLHMLAITLFIFCDDKLIINSPV